MTIPNTERDASYESFLSSKRLIVPSTGITVNAGELNPALFPFQRVLVKWSLAKGRAALFCDTGTGKSIMQLTWAARAAERALILAPLSVARQTVAEGAKFGIKVTYARNQSQSAAAGITITNYEMLPHFDPAYFGAVVLDESSILKAFDGKTRTALIETFRDTPMRLCCTATPAPNDISEIANHAEFLGVMSRTEMLAAFFVHDENGWRLKGHAREPFYRWLASWGMSLKRPSDLGFSDEGYILPELDIQQRTVPAQWAPAGQMFATTLKGISGRSAVRKDTAEPRVRVAAGLIRSEPEQWIAWCGLNAEQDALAKELGSDCVSVYGSLSPDEKADRIERWVRGDVRVMVTKAEIAGMGLNFQQCARMVFVGVGDSYEKYYQAIRRCWRFGQTRPVHAYIVLSEPEQVVYQNVLRKEVEAEQMARDLVQHVAAFEREEIASSPLGDFEYDTDEATGRNYRWLLGDSTERLRELPDDSIDLSVYSPPFDSLYVYSNTERDLGNSRSTAEFIEHYNFIIAELLRVTKPGRVTAVHVSDIAAMLTRDGYIGLKDFSGDVIRAYIAQGWVWDARIPIMKNPQAQSIRTHSKALTMTQHDKDRSWQRPALPDYILKFRKPGENAVPVNSGDVSRDTWIEWANPAWPGEGDRAADSGSMSTWLGIRESDTLNARAASSPEDERHLCPLQRPTIERCVRLWSNPGELVLSPFGGIGSEGYVAVKCGRRFIGIELKRQYWETGLRNLQDAESATGDMLSLLDSDAA